MPYARCEWVLSRQNYWANVMDVFAYVVGASFASFMRAYARIRMPSERMPCEYPHFCILVANARISAQAMGMRSFTHMQCAYARISAHSMRLSTFLGMLCECSHMRTFWCMQSDALRMRALMFQAMRVRASRKKLCVSGTV